MLDDPRPVLVGGDEASGFYRSSDLSSEKEAYSWGGLTSRSLTRALWVLLLPFALANVAGWMVVREIPGGAPGGKAALRHRQLGRVAAALVRSLSLWVTVLAVLWVASIAVDIFAFQCGTKEACAGQQFWLRWLTAESLQVHPGRRLVVTMVVPLALLVGLWQLTSSSVQRYEEPMPRRRAKRSQIRLRRYELWSSPGRVRGLALLHSLAALSALGAVASWALLRFVRSLDAGTELTLLAAWLNTVVLIAVLVVTTLHAGDATRRHAWYRRLSAPIAASGFVLAIVAGWLAPEAGSEAGAAVTNLGTAFPAVAWWFALPPLVLLLACLLVCLAIGGAIRRARRSPRVGFRGQGAVVALVLGFVVMASLLSGAAIWFADWLGRRPGAVGEAPVINPSLGYLVVAVGLLVFLAAVVLAALLFWGYAVGIRSRERIRAMDEEWRKEAGEAIPPRSRRIPVHRLRWLKGIDRLRTMRERWLPGLQVVFTAGVIATMATVITYAYDQFGPGDPNPLDRVLFNQTIWGRALVDMSRSLIVLAPLAAVYLVYTSLRNPGRRRLIGILWDVLTFWPRWFHPFAPPSYTTRAEPQLGSRIERLVRGEGPDRTVLVSGHSQGSVIAVATVARLQPEVRARTALLTFGSPLTSLYGRFFPDFFDEAQLGLVARDLGGRWRNVYRRTDPIGGKIFETKASPVDRESPDPLPERPAHGDPLPAPKAHSFYTEDPPYSKARDELERLLDGIDRHVDLEALPTT